MRGPGQLSPLEISRCTVKLECTLLKLWKAADTLLRFVTSCYTQSLLAHDT